MEHEISKLLSRRDLNLIVTLDVLLKERNVSRAAEVLFVSQSAMSRSLKRLRETFDDPLFTRVATGLIPTPKALELEKQLKPILLSLNEIFAEEAFDPMLCEQSFSIALPAFISSAITPKLLRQLDEFAPGISIKEYPAKANPFTAIDQGYMDFALHYLEPTHDKYIAQELGILCPQLFARRDHPLLKSENITLDKALDYPLLGMLVEEDIYHSFSAPILQVYSDLMIDRKPKLRSSQTQILIDVMCSSDAVLFGTNSLQSLSGFNEDFQLLHSMENEKRYTVPVYLVQHERTEHSSAHQWMNALLSQLLQELLITTSV
ncbi:LysR family transcriptional regulator [Vibrio lamellibrachiae]|uniref:LysR family transcriptional regulator n=1 Tax=Vibrio lamellibrachiae TaxID=2910253 RepID=UPI003D0EA799